MKNLFVLLVLLISNILLMDARVFSVNSVGTFNNAHNSANQNDTISWKQGTFQDIDIVLKKDGVIFIAEVSGETIFSGSSKLIVESDDNFIGGFQYIGGELGVDEDVIIARGERCRFSDIHINDYTSRRYLTVANSAQYNVFSYCTFANRKGPGIVKNTFQMNVDDRPNGEGSFHTIEYCQFNDMIGPGQGKDNGVEALRVGLLFQGDNIGRNVIEYNYFTKCDGDAEIISNKSSQNIYRYNTFDNNQFGRVEMRHGRECSTYGNFFMNGLGGVQIREGQNHSVYNNYMIDVEEAFNLRNDPVDTPEDIYIAHNTIINSGGFKLGGSGDDDPKNVTIANNIFYVNDDNVTNNQFRDLTGNETFVSNILDGPSNLATNSGIIETDPDLVINSAGYYELNAGSPAVDASKESGASVFEIGNPDNDDDIRLDILKSGRPFNKLRKDIGAQEFDANSESIEPHVTADNTGARYLQPQQTNTKPVVTITSPVNGSTINVGDVVTIKANATDSDGSIDRVNFRVDGDFIGQVRTAPYEEQFTFTTSGTFEILVGAIDNDDAVSTSKITVTVSVVSNTENLESVGRLAVFPNPSVNGVFNLSRLADWEVMNVNGQVIISGNTEEINIKGYSSGIYFLRIGDQMMKLVRE